MHLELTENSFLTNEVMLCMCKSKHLRTVNIRDAGIHINLHTISEILQNNIHLVTFQIRRHSLNSECKDYVVIHMSNRLKYCEDRFHASETALSVFFACLRGFKKIYLSNIINVTRAHDRTILSNNPGLVSYSSS